MRLDNKVVVVTGGLGQLGQATAEVVAELGARLVLIDAVRATARREPAQEACLLLDGVDLTDAAQARSAIDAAAAHFGRIDALVNVAGTFRWETVADGDPATWDFLYQINVRTALLASQAALPHLREAQGGRIVNIGSSSAQRAGLGRGAYAASKSGVARLTESLAEELKDQGITVNAVLPSIIDTPQNRRDMPDADFERWVKPIELARVIAFLLSDAGQPITGASIPVSGRL
jgi:NAD(P)-dependent dehydrogenase (short-subunit alcohol dehydrogenase family)